MPCAVCRSTTAVSVVHINAPGRHQRHIKGENRCSHQEARACQQTVHVNRRTSRHVDAAPPTASCSLVSLPPHGGSTDNP